MESIEEVVRRYVRKSGLTDSDVGQLTGFEPADGPWEALEKIVTGVLRKAAGSITGGAGKDPEVLIAGSGKQSRLCCIEESGVILVACADGCIETVFLGPLKDALLKDRVFAEDRRELVVEHPLLPGGTLTFETGPWTNDPRVVNLSDRLRGILFGS